MNRKSSPMLLNSLIILALLCAPLSFVFSPGRSWRAASASPARISPEQAIEIALGGMQATADGLRVERPGFTAVFGPSGLSFTPQGDEEAWTWQLSNVSAGDQRLVDVDSTALHPQQGGPLSVVYQRGGLVEQYIVRQQTLEQQFILAEALPLGGQALVIEGRVRSAGQFSASPRGWTWRTAQGLVALGQVWVFDAAGSTLPATLEVSASSTRIVIDGAALAAAVYPVTVDPEIGPNDFLLSDMGSSSGFSADTPAVAYNSANNEYLVVWSGDDNTSPLVDGENEIFGQRVNAATGAQVGANDFRISTMGPDGNTNYAALTPAVAYNSTDNEYLVVWQGDDNTVPLVDNESEIFGQRLNAATGAETGVDDFRLSDMGPNGDTSYSAAVPAVAYNNIDNEYLVVWRADDNTSPLVDNENEIFGQRLSGVGIQQGSNDFRISEIGPDGDTNFVPTDPVVVFNSADDQYLVVWRGDDDTSPLVDNEQEVFGQRLSALGTQLGSNDFRISSLGPDGNASYDATGVKAVYNSVNSEYLVVWNGDDNTPPLVENEIEIFGQRLTAATGAEVGADDFRISDMGPDGNINFRAFIGGVSYSSGSNEYLVVWRGTDNTGLLAAEEFEVFGQRLNAASGAEVGSNDFRLSDLGPDGDAAFDANSAAVAFNSTNSEYLVVFDGDDNVGGWLDDENEVFGQRVSATGGELGDNDFVLSDMGSNLGFTAKSPAVAYNSANNEFLVVWVGNDNIAPLVGGEQEIFGQRVDAATGLETGANDFRISSMGPDGDTAYDTASVNVAYNSNNNEYLVVWHADDDTGSLVDNENEIYGQRINAASGAEVGTDDFRISNMGPDGDPAYGATFPNVTYNSTDSHYLVVWMGDTNTSPLVDNEVEVFGQRLRGVDCAQIGSNDFRISDMGPDGDTTYGVGAPVTVYNSVNNEYLVVWQGDDNTAPLVDNEQEIFGQRLSAAGAAVGTNDFRISNLGPNGDANYDANGVRAAYNSTDNEYLVVFGGDDNSGGLVNDELEIFGQLLDAATGAEVGHTDFHISDMGTDGDPNFDAFVGEVSYSSLKNQYLVVWVGDDNSGALVDSEFEVFGQLLKADGTQTGDNDFRLSDLGPDGAPLYGIATPPGAAFNPQYNFYLVVFDGDDNVGEQSDGAFEIYGQMFRVPLELFLPMLVR